MSNLIYYYSAKRQVKTEELFFSGHTPKKRGNNEDKKAMKISGQF